jgi:hypothetical protein
MISLATARRRPSIVTVGIAAGLAGAVAIDLYLIVVESFVMRIATPIVVMQWDASNALGMAAYRGGWATAALGTLMHFCVSSLWGILFTTVATRVGWLTSRPLASGTLLGILAMTVMRGVIHFGHAVVRPFSAESFLVILIAHTLFFGIPVALVASRLLQTERG